MFRTVVRVLFADRRRRTTPNPFTASDHAQFALRVFRGLSTLCVSSPSPPWPRLEDFHYAPTNHSYYRTNSDGDVPEQFMGCSDSYHKQNWKTSKRLAGRDLKVIKPPIGAHFDFDICQCTLKYFANKWQSNCQ